MTNATVKNMSTFSPNVKLIERNDSVWELQTIIRDRDTCMSDFIFYADRLIRLVIEEGLNQLPAQPCVITTPTGAEYQGLTFEKGNCGVSICRSGEAMEKALRECCQSIRIGKILIDSDAQTKRAKVGRQSRQTPYASRCCTLGCARMWPIDACCCSIRSCTRAIRPRPHSMH